MVEGLSFKSRAMVLTVSRALSGDRAFSADCSANLTQRRGVRSRVEEGRGSLSYLQSPRFPSPLVKPDVRISRIRLSD